MIINFKEEHIPVHIQKIDSEHYEIHLGNEKHIIKLTKFYSINNSRCGYIIFEWKNQFHKAILTEDDTYFYITINGKNFILSKSTQEEINYSTQIELEITEILAPLPGTITKIYVKDKEEVKQNDLLLIIESMKMENQIRSPKNAIIDKIYIKEGEKVETNQMLIKLI